jgi:hypothetical protein
MYRLTRMFRVLFGRRRFEDHMSDELASHLDHYVDDLEKAGVPRNEAMRRARIEFGNVDNVRADCREVRRVRWIDDAAHDLRYAARLFARNPGLAVVTVLTLAAAFGANHAIFRAVETILSRPLPYRDAGRLAVLWKAPPQSSGVREDSGVRRMAPCESFVRGSRVRDSVRQCVHASHRGVRGTGGRDRWTPGPSSDVAEEAIKDIIDLMESVDSSVRTSRTVDA